MKFLQQLLALQDTDFKGKLILGAFANLQGAIISFFVSVRPSVCQCVRSLETTWHTQDGFSQNLVFQDFHKICRENPILIKIGQE